MSDNQSRLRELGKAIRQGNLSLALVMVIIKDHLRILSMCDECGLQPLHMAAKACHSHTPLLIQMFIRFGADPNALSKAGFPPLLYALHAGNIPAVKALLTGQVEGALCKPYLPKANPSWQDKYGLSLLLVAVSFGYHEACQALLEAGANPDLANEFGTTPRALARLSSREVMTLFL